MKQHEAFSFFKSLLPWMVSTFIGVVVGSAVIQANVSNIDRRLSADELQIIRNQQDLTDIKTNIGVIKERTNTLKEDLTEIKQFINELK